MNAPTNTTQNLATNQAIVADAVLTGSTLASFSTPLRIACGHAKEIHFGVASNAAVTVTLRHFGAGRRVVVDNTATAVAAGTPLAIRYYASAAGTGVLDEVELVVTNASGGTATISATLKAV